MSQAPPPPEPGARARLPLWLALAVLLGSASLHAPPLDAGLYLDDTYRVAQNPALDQFWPPWRHFGDPSTNASLPHLVQYRPLLPLSLSIEAALADALEVERSALHRLGNVALLFLCGALLYGLLRALLARGSPGLAQRAAPIALFAAALFCAHPVAGIPVHYVCSRDLLLMLAPLCGALWVYVDLRSPGRESALRWCAFLALGALSMLGKQNAVVLPALVLCLELTVLRASPLSLGPWLRAMLSALPIALFFVVTELVIGFSDLGQLTPEHDMTRFEYACTQLRAHLDHYAFNAAWPYQLRFEFEVAQAGGLGEPGVLAGLCLVLASLFVAWRARSSMPLLSFAILAYWVLFAPTSSVRPFRRLATDYRQLPSLPWLALIVALCLARLPRRAATALGALLLAHLAIASLAMGRHWQTSESFWYQSVRYDGAANAHLNYGLAVSSRDAELADEHYAIALEKSPGNVYALINRGLLWIDHLGRPTEGLALVEQARDRATSWALAHYWLAQAYRRVGQHHDRAEAAFRAATMPGATPEYVRSAIVALEEAHGLALEANDRVRAQAHLGRLAQLDPSADLYARARALQLAGQTPASLPPLEQLHASGEPIAESLFLHGWALHQGQRFDEAIPLYEAQLERDDAHVQTRKNLAHGLLQRGDAADALPHYLLLLERRPADNDLHHWLAECYSALGDEERAAHHAALYAGG